MDNLLLRYDGTIQPEICHGRDIVLTIVAVNYPLFKYQMFKFVFAFFIQRVWIRYPIECSIKINIWSKRNI